MTRRDTRIIMGMPITIAVADAADLSLHEIGFAYFETVDARFSPYKPGNEVSRLNRGETSIRDCSRDMADILALAELTRAETEGYFDIRRPEGGFDPSGIVKGWAIRNAARLIAEAGGTNFYVEAGGDLQAVGCNAEGEPWRAGIRHPDHPDQIVKVVSLCDAGMATSGNYVRGSHIYDPHTRAPAASEIVSLTVIAGDICDADRFATAAFAMGARGIDFIESRPGLEGYQVDRDGMATMTSGFSAYVVEDSAR